MAQAKQQKHDYHESKSPHLHAIFFTYNLRHFRLEKRLTTIADVEDKALKGYISGSQQDRGQGSSWDIHEEESNWDDEAQRCVLNHTKDDNKKMSTRVRQSWTQFNITKTFKWARGKKLCAHRKRSMCNIYACVFVFEVLQADNTW